MSSLEQRRILLGKIYAEAMKVNGDTELSSGLRRVAGLFSSGYVSCGEDVTQTKENIIAGLNAANAQIQSGERSGHIPDQSALQRIAGAIFGTAPLLPQPSSEQKRQMSIPESIIKRTAETAAATLHKN